MALLYFQWFQCQSRVQRLEQGSWCHHRFSWKRSSCWRAKDLVRLRCWHQWASWEVEASSWACQFYSLCAATVLRHWKCTDCCSDWQHLRKLYWYCLSGSSRAETIEAASCWTWSFSCFAQRLELVDSDFGWREASITRCNCSLSRSRHFQAI